MPKSLDDIFNEDTFGLLDSKPEKSVVVTDEDRLINAFEEINTFYDANKREPATGSMAEYSLYARLTEYRNNEKTKSILKAFDRHNLLGEVKHEIESVDDIFEDDALGLLETDGDASIFIFKHAPEPGSRAEADYVAQRKPMSEREFKKYEAMFQKVHRELKEGKRKLLPFSDAERNLIEGNFYLVDGLLAYLEVSNAEEVLKKNESGDRVRLEGRTVTVFENGTVSNMLFRSLGKAIQKNGRLVTNTEESMYKELLENTGQINEEDIHDGWIYILKSKSEIPLVKNIQNLYKIGFTKQPVSDRIRNASSEATYLYAEVELVASYAAYNLNANVLESLLHKFFGKACLDIDLYDKQGNRYNPREWFIAPLSIIDEAVQMLVKGTIVNYRYDMERQKIVLKSGE